MHPLATIEFRADWIYTFGVILGFNALLGLCLLFKVGDKISRWWGTHPLPSQKALKRGLTKLKAHHDGALGWKWYTYMYPLILALAIMAILPWHPLPRDFYGNADYALLFLLLCLFTATIESMWWLWQKKHHSAEETRISISGRVISHAGGFTYLCVYWTYLILLNNETPNDGLGLVLLGFLLIPTIGIALVALVPHLIYLNRWKKSRQKTAAD